MVFARRDLYRRAVFSLMTPFFTDLSIKPKVSGRSVLASAALPVAIAARNLFIWVFSLCRFIWLIRRLRWLWRYRLSADGWLAILSPSKTEMIAHCGVL